MTSVLKTFLQEEYADRDQRLAGRDLYSVFNRAQLFAVHQRQRQELELLRRHGFNPLGDKRILEVGCGRASILNLFMGYGASPYLLHGIDLLEDRVHDAHGRFPNLPLACADGQQLPYLSDSFDLVLQYTALSSILDGDMRAKVAGEMLRVVHAGGMILWYDFWLNPSNPQTHGIRAAEIKRLFPDCDFEFRRVTLAPPITRRLVNWSWSACFLLEKLKVLNSHYLVAIRHSRK